jgi:hypothetical protein
MTRGGNDPPNPPSSPSTASLSGVARYWHSNDIFRYFLRYFSSTPRTDLSKFRGTFHSFDPVGFAIFANVADCRAVCRRDGEAKRLGGLELD